jgi:hypothetical protein
MRNLIICPVGNPVTFDNRFDEYNHWRYIKTQREYETIVFQYSDFVPEKGTYDMLIKQSGFKWSIAKQFLNDFDYTQYDYIGFFDDDLITDIENINRALTIAWNNNLSAFQLSLTQDSDVFYPILKNKPELKYSKTNFIEVMGPFIHSSKIPMCLELWDKYDIFSGWGFDKVLSDLIQDDLTVIHSSQMYHPKKTSAYDKTKAFAEMDKLLIDVFPKFMLDKYNQKWTFKEEQIEKQLIMEL